MDFYKCFLLIGISIILFFHDLSNVEGRHHIHSSKKHKSNNANAGSPAYAPAPSPGDPVSDPPEYPPPVASDPTSPPAPDPGNSTTGCIFNVMEFGAVGDGSTDDTAPFRDAWKAACQAESSVLLAPAEYTFLITSTIFSGPCKPGLVFQVRLQNFILQLYFDLIIVN